MSEHVSCLQVKLKTHETDIAVPDTELSLPLSLDSLGLTKLIVGLLQESYLKTDTSNLNLSFCCLNDLICGTLEEFLADRDDISKSETVFEIEYFRSTTPPDPQESKNHEDWVSGVSAHSSGLALSCSYDGQVFLWDLNSGVKKLTISGHEGPAKAVSWISLTSESATFVSCGQDQILKLYEWNITQNSLSLVNACKGHERSVDSLAVHSSLMASGSFDTNIKIWSTKLCPFDDSESDVKKFHGLQKPLTRTPLLTIAGHKEGIRGLDFLGTQNELASVSMDHTLKIWDTEFGTLKNEFVGNKAFFDMSYSSLNHCILTASADRFIRIYDPRSSEGTIVKNTYTSHKGWVTSVDWSKDNNYHFISGSHDQFVKMWDTRSVKTPLFDCTGHSDRVLAVDWGSVSHILSGGADNDMKIFQTG